MRAYPNGPLAANLIGYVSEINADELKARGQEGYRQGDLIGKDGIEQTFEDVLRGTPRKLRVEVDSQGRVVRTIEDRKAVPGKDVKLTLDADIQRMAEQSLAQGMDGARQTRDQNEKQRFANYRAGAGAVVALDPNDGSVVAMASNPTYDPRQFAAGITPEEFQQLNRPESNFPLVNRACTRRGRRSSSSPRSRVCRRGRSTRTQVSPTRVASTSATSSAATRGRPRTGR